MTDLDKIEAAEFSVVCLPWKGSPCMVKLRNLDDIEIQSIGNFSLIEIDEYKWSRSQAKTPWGDLLAYADQNAKICRAALVAPSYDQIFEAIGKTDFNGRVKAQVEHINSLLGDMLDGPAKQELEGMRDSLILAWGVLLPDDFMAGVVSFSLGIKKSDIKKVTDDMLCSAAILAERGHRAPHEYIHGAFSDFNIRDIDMMAWIVLDRRREEIRAEAKRTRGADHGG